LGINHAFRIGRAGLIHRAGYLSIAFAVEGIEFSHQLIPAENPFCRLGVCCPASTTFPGEEIFKAIGFV